MDIAVPVLVQLLPKEHYKWINVIVGYSIKSIGITVAWLIQSVQSAFQSAVKGGLLFSTAILSYLKTKGHIPQDMDLEKMRAKEIIAGLVTFIGFYWQLSNGLSLPFPMNVRSALTRTAFLLHLRLPCLADLVAASPNLGVVPQVASEHFLCSRSCLETAKATSGILSRRTCTSAFVSCQINQSDALSQMMPGRSSELSCRD